MLFNQCGYRLVANWLQEKTETRLEAAIEEKTYDPENLLELSVVTNLPYTNDWSDWERISGSVEVNGLHYQYVERKMEKGNMLYRCLPNTEKQNLLAARDEFFQLVNNFNNQADNRKSSPSVVINNFIGDYDDARAQYALAPATYSISLSNPWPVFVSPVTDLYTAIPHQPPKC